MVDGWQCLREWVVIRLAPWGLWFVIRASAALAGQQVKPPSKHPKEASRSCRFAKTDRLQATGIKHSCRREQKPDLHKSPISQAEVWTQQRLLANQARQTADQAYWCIGTYPRMVHPRACWSSLSKGDLGIFGGLGVALFIDRSM